MSTHSHTRALREIAKFCTGLIAADIIVGIWLGFGFGQGYPSVFLGVPLSQNFIGAWLVFDIVLLALLVHYAWHVTVPVSSAKKTVLYIIGTLLGIVAILHFLRVLFGVSVVIGTVSIPGWISIVGVLITAFLSYASFHFARYRE